VSPARVPVTERPLRKPSASVRITRERSHPDRQVPRGRSQQERDALVSAHLALASFAVNAVAARISLPGHVSREDLLSCAHVALVEVAKRFDPSAGASFATYALPRLQGAVLDELRSGDWASRSVRSAARRTDAAADALTISLGRPPTREELAASLGIARSDLDSLQVDVHRAVMISIDAETGPVGTSLDLPDTGESPERALLRGERARHLHEAIRALPDRLDEVVERNFFGDESLTDIAEDLGVTLSRVSQMRARALTLLHAAMSEVWEGQAVPAEGGVRARNQQRSYVDRVAGRSPMPIRNPGPTSVPLARQRYGQPTAHRDTTHRDTTHRDTTAQPA
jgi:RNA polymerase sigma factor for flagellar operon FliA